MGAICSLGVHEFDAECTFQEVCIATGTCYYEPCLQRECKL